jgi:glycosyltransferase involved in cell wall biosynthesis
VKLLLATGIFPPDIGGPATYVPALSAALSARGHQVTVVTASDAMDHDDRGYPFRVVRIPRGMNKALRFAHTVRTLRRLGRDADVWFVNGFFLEAVVAGAGSGRPMLQKVVGDLAWERGRVMGWVSDGFDTFQAKRYPGRVGALQRLRSFWTRRADTVLVPSHYLAGTVRGWGVDPARIRVIYNAVEALPGLRPAPRPLPTPFTVCTVARLVPWKHVDRIIQVLAPWPDAGLVVVGDGPDRAALEARARELGSADRVHFAGQRDKRGVQELLSACDAFVLNSSYEGLPHIVVEAMQLGVPVVATAVGGTPEVVRDGHTGLLVPVGDDAALGRALGALRDDPALRTRLAAGARAAAARAHGFDAMVDRTEALLRSLATPPARPGRADAATAPLG